MKRLLYFLYVCAIMLIVFVAGRERDGERSWSNSTGRGYYSGGGHK
ncbi:hypothetical protein LF41_300 [Lysobacter dokdonensis DS-58]|uniref:Uncharacterized protein n=1 Tax=Lysobacter dokdonensis DS-58 TaxID=1300345 RepID=A0A0A2WJ77_9GAMM|nr:hypothetical protein [Lysobacter dokdonensis]KGQ18767.1 hypothetical protein LF41_300 [Lysobacter dokdonensis DS-58]